MRRRTTPNGRNSLFALRVSNEELRLLRRRAQRVRRSMAQIIRDEGIEEAIADERRRDAPRHE